MKISIYKSYDDLPLFLNAETVAQVLGVSISSAYELLHEPGFPVVRVGIEVHCHRLTGGQPRLLAVGEFDLDGHVTYLNFHLGAPSWPSRPCVMGGRSAR